MKKRFSATALLLIMTMAFIIPAMSVSANVPTIVNGDFEDPAASGVSIPGWTVTQNVGSNLKINTDTAYTRNEGARSVGIIRTAVVNNYTMVSKVSGLTVGKKYRVSGWFHCSSNVTGVTHAARIFGGNVDVETLPSAITFSGTGSGGTNSRGLPTKYYLLDQDAPKNGWVKLSVTFMAEADKDHYVGVNATIGVAGSTLEVYWDDITITEVRGLIDNGDFEEQATLPTTGSNAWKAFGEGVAAEITDGIADGVTPLGDYCMSLANCTADTYLAYDVTGLEPDVNYKLSFKARSPLGVSSIPFLTVYNITTTTKSPAATNTRASLRTLSLPAGGDFQQFTVYFTVTDGTSDNARRIRLYNGSENKVYIDDVILEPAPTKPTLGFRDSMGFDISAAAAGSAVTAYVYLPRSVADSVINDAETSLTFIKAEYCGGDMSFADVADLNAANLNTAAAFTVGELNSGPGMYSTTVAIIPDTGDDSLKVLLWQDLDDIEPLAGSARLTINK